MSRRAKIVILDSGIGGITVAAPLAQQLMDSAGMGLIELAFVDVKPRRGGFNDLSSAEQIRAFSSDLQRIEALHAPALIAIACNTLTAVYEQIPERGKIKCAVLGIIDPACQAIAQWARRHPAAPIRIFGTPTTIRSASYQSKLNVNPAIGSRVTAIPCPSLPGLMESATLSAAPQVDFQCWIQQAREAARNGGIDQPGLSVLACTHFALDLKSVQAQFRIGGLACDVILNPNDAMITAIKGTIAPPNGQPTKVKMTVSSLHSARLRHRQALENYLGATAPAVLNALQAGE